MERSNISSRNNSHNRPILNNNNLQNSLMAMMDFNHIQGNKTKIAIKKTRIRIMALIDTMGTILRILVISILKEVEEEEEDQSIIVTTTEAMFILNLAVEAIITTTKTNISTNSQATQSTKHYSIRISQKLIKIRQNQIIRKIIILSIMLITTIRRLNFLTMQPPTRRNTLRRFSMLRIRQNFMERKRRNNRRAL